MNEINERVKSIIVEKLGVEEDEVNNDAHFMEDLGADSLDTVELIMEFERTFNIHISDDKTDKIRTVGDAINIINELKEEQ